MYVCAQITRPLTRILFWHNPAFSIPHVSLNYEPTSPYRVIILVQMPLSAGLKRSRRGRADGCTESSEAVCYSSYPRVISWKFLRTSYLYRQMKQSKWMYGISEANMGNWRSKKKKKKKKRSHLESSPLPWYGSKREVGSPCSGYPGLRYSVIRVASWLWRRRRRTKNPARQPAMTVPGWWAPVFAHLTMARRP